MTDEKLVGKYIENTRQVFQQLEESKNRYDKRAGKVLDHARRYFDDAVFYRNQKRFDISLASVAYCEGILDALRLLEMIEFQWSAENK
ncbi:MAG: DUF357 domain-containing protein [Candidatus Bathyarchaeia archaeon]